MNQGSKNAKKYLQTFVCVIQYKNNRLLMYISTNNDN